MQDREKTQLRVLLIALQPQHALKALDVPGICVCGIAGRMQEALRLLPSLQPHAVVFFDPQPSLAQTLKQLCELLPGRRAVPRTPCLTPAIFPRFPALFSPHTMRP